MSRLTRATLILFACISAGCAKSPSGSVEELIKTRPPTFGGLAYKAYTTASQAFLASGECDPISYGIEYSYDQSTWTDIGSCASGTFSINVVVLGTLNVYVRARTKMGHTSAGHAYIRLLLPPTSPFIAQVNATASDEVFTLGTQMAIEHTFTAATLNNGLVEIKTSLVDMIYGP